MATKKITLNELRSIVKQIIKEETEITPKVGETYKNVDVLTQNGKYIKMVVNVRSIFPNEKKAIVRTENGGDAIVSFDDLRQI